MDKVGIGVIGCGVRMRVLLGQVMAKSDRLAIAAVHDVSKEAAEKTRDAFGKTARVHEDFRGLVADPNVQWVMVGSWNCAHAEQVVAAFAAGKNVFCEKPLATTVDDCLAMRQAYLAAGRAFVIGYTLRYAPQCRKVQQLIANGAIGDVISLEFNETIPSSHGAYIHGDWRRHSRLAGPHVLEKCSHDIDLMNWYLGTRPRRAASFGGCDFYTPKYRHRINEIGPAADGKRAYLDWWEVLGYKEPPADPFGTDKDIVDNQVAVIEYENNVRAAFHTNLNAGIPERRTYICGSEGTIRSDLTAGRIEMCRIGWDGKVTTVPIDAGGEHSGGDAVLAQNIADAMTAGAAGAASMDDGVVSAVTCLGIDEARRTGNVYDFTPIWQKAKLPPVTPRK